MNEKYGLITLIRSHNEPNLFEITMLDIGPLYTYQINLESKEKSCGFLIESLYISRGQYYK